MLTGQSQDEASTHWKRAFTLSLQGAKLETAELDELALASYTASLQQFQQVSENHPDFLPDLVSFRIEKLQQQVTELTSSAKTETSTATEQYLSYIKLAEQADSERDSYRYLKALVTFKEASKQLETVIALKPEAYGAALSSQKQLLDSEVLRLNHRYVKRYQAPTKPSPTVSQYSNYGTTRYVEKIDLPTGGGLDSSPSLFPGR